VSVYALRRSNPWVLSHRSEWVKTGDGEIPRSGCPLRCGRFERGRDGQKVGGFMRYAQRRILPRGSGPLGSLNLALVGSLLLVTSAAGATSFGVRVKRPAMESLTTKGAKALESKPCVEAVPNREKPLLMDKGMLLVSVPRNRRELRRKLCSAGRSRHRAMVWRPVLLATRPARQKSSLIREGPPLPPVVRRCLGGVVAVAWPLVGNGVFQRQRTGRVA
jgi:hypothetical protein